jgi:hypothetical protein
MYLYLFKAINSIQIPAYIQNIVGICKEITLIIFYKISYVGFEILTAVVMKSSNF